MKEEVISQFMKLEGVGRKKAEALYEAGYRSFEDLQKAEIEELSSVEGIGRALAERIKEQLSEIAGKVEEIEERDEEFERLLRVREILKKKRPEFRRYQAHKKKALDDSWRRPRGIHNKLRRRFAGKGNVVQIGYGSPRKVRGIHPSGYEEVLVRTLSDLENVDPSKQIVRIASTVGTKKRLKIEKYAESLGIRVINKLRRED
ncbi:MAG: large subunit ribosomal protein L32e [Archaeoglobi archaeon]|nr:50S ribosomal protein L32e [Candidatus Mnemosynella bozhongmuii]MDI3502603.1 large subunit ribosomal protein L32e [Archaeoglobi archaeon]MDK2781004.1 large subunit ribosomal protein L32e [Archaeoglobi archaeon]